MNPSKFSSQTLHARVKLYIKCGRKTHATATEPQRSRRYTNSLLSALNFTIRRLKLSGERAEFRYRGLYEPNQNKTTATFQMWQRYCDLVFRYCKLLVKKGAAQVVVFQISKTILTVNWEYFRPRRIRIRSWLIPEPDVPFANSKKMIARAKAFDLIARNMAIQMCSCCKTSTALTSKGMGNSKVQLS